MKTIEHQGCATVTKEVDDMPLFKPQKKQVHENSIEAYRGIDITQRQAEVVRALEKLGRATDKAIADFLGVTINRVAGRITELRNKGLVKEICNITGGYGKRVRVCKLQ